MAAEENPNLNQTAAKVKLSPIEQGYVAVLQAVSEADLEPLLNHKTPSIRGAAVVRQFALGHISATAARAQLKGSSGTGMVNRFLRFATGWADEWSEWSNPEYWSKRTGNMADAEFIELCTGLHNDGLLAQAIRNGLPLTELLILELGKTKQCQRSKLELLGLLVQTEADPARAVETALVLQADDYLAQLIPEIEEMPAGLLSRAAAGKLARSVWALLQRIELDAQTLDALAEVPSWTYDGHEISEGERYPDSAFTWFNEVSSLPMTSYHVQHVVAAHELTSAETLTKLVKSNSAFVRAGLAGRTGVDDAILTKLAKDKDAGVRRAAAGNLSCSVKLLTALASDAELDVRTAACENPNATDEVKALAALVH